MSRDACSAWLDRALQKLLKDTVNLEEQQASRDLDIAAVQEKYGRKIGDLEASVARLTAEIEGYYREHRSELEPADKRSLQLQFGLVGMRAPSNPALVLLSKKWTWPKAAAKLKRAFKQRFFHKPKPPGLDKEKVKSELEKEQLAKYGLKLDEEDRFYIQLNRVAQQEAA